MRRVWRIKNNFVSACYQLYIHHYEKNCKNYNHSILHYITFFFKLFSIALLFWRHLLKYELKICRWAIFCLCWPWCDKSSGNLQCKGCKGRVRWPQWPLLYADGFCQGMGDAVHRWDVELGANLKCNFFQGFKFVCLCNLCLSLVVVVFIVFLPFCFLSFCSRLLHPCWLFSFYPHILCSFSCH